MLTVCNSIDKIFSSSEIVQKCMKECKLSNIHIFIKPPRGGSNWQVASLYLIHTKNILRPNKFAKTWVKKKPKKSSDKNSNSRKKTQGKLTLFSNYSLGFLLSQSIEP